MADVFTVGSLFSGYGGIELGLEQAGGFRTIWHCEIMPYPAAVLAERWPGIPNLGDITKVDWGGVERPDVLCGGFPCQDISVAGKQAGIIKGGNRSGLWGEFHKAIGLLRPRYVVIENVSALANLGLDIVLADLAEAGYDAEWIDLRACDFGAPHKRERIFIVAYSPFERCGEEGKFCDRSQERIACCGVVPDTSCNGQQHSKLSEHSRRESKEASTGRSLSRRHEGFEAEPCVGRVVDGVARGLDSFVWRERIKALGNGVVPQVAQWVGEQILKAEGIGERDEKVAK